MAQKKRYTDADIIRINLVCASAYRAGVPLDQGYLRLMEDAANQQGNTQLAQNIQQHATQHRKLDCRQVGFWGSVCRWLNACNE